MSIKLNFTQSSKDSIKLQAVTTLPPGTTFDGLSVGVVVAGHADQAKISK